MRHNEKLWFIWDYYIYVVNHIECSAKTSWRLMPCSIKHDTFWSIMDWTLTMTDRNKNQFYHENTNCRWQLSNCNKWSSFWSCFAFALQGSFIMLDINVPCLCMNEYQNLLVSNLEDIFSIMPLSLLSIYIYIWAHDVLNNMQLISR
jgi:hypothetical protein